MSRTIARQVVVALAFVILLPTMALAQTGSIAGMVRDTSGAMMPGVTVEAASPALIETGANRHHRRERGSTRSSTSGRACTPCTFTLPGFSRREARRHRADDAVHRPVNADMRVGAIAETITVTGESPVVDTQRICSQKVMTRDVIDAVPTGQTFQNIGVLVPGVTLGGRRHRRHAVRRRRILGRSSRRRWRSTAAATADMVVQMDGMRFNNLCGAGSYTRHLGQRRAASSRSASRPARFPRKWEPAASA